MRRFPSSWDRTLSALGFRRNIKRIKRDHYRRKNSRIEPLEVRAMLAANNLLGTETHHWTFDTDGTDSVGTVDTSLNNGAFIDSSTGFLGSSALRLDGSDDHGYIDHAQLEDSFSKYSITAWFYANNTSGSQIIYEEGGVTNGIALRLNGSDLEAAVGNNADLVTTSISGVSPNEWHFAVVTFDNGSLTLYLDGSEQTNTANAAYTSIPQHTDAAGIGRQTSASSFGAGTGSYFEGLLDDIRVFNNHVLSPIEISFLENANLLSNDSYVVTTLADQSDGNLDDGLSLREAIAIANLTPGADSITISESLFASGSQTIVLGDTDGNGLIEGSEDPSQLEIDSDLSIIGPGSDLLTISGANDTRVLRVTNDLELDVEISGLTIANGRSSSGAGIYSHGNNLTLDDVNFQGNYAMTWDETNQYFTAGSGGAINFQGQDWLDHSTLTITNSTYDGNYASHGGAIYSYGGYADIEIDAVTFSNNHAFYRMDDQLEVITTGNFLNGFGGALSLTSYDLHNSGIKGSVEIKNSTFHHNEAERDGGAIATARSYFTVDIINSTISSNTALRSGGIKVSYDQDLTIVNSTITENSVTGWSTSGGIENLTTNPANLTLHNTIVAGNTNPSGNAYDLRGDLETDSSHNLIGNWTVPNTLPVGNNNQIDSAIDPGLAPLGDYGGATWTHALDSDSPVIDAGDNTMAASIASDQRAGQEGFSDRTVNGIVDIGAFEYGATIIESSEASYIATADPIDVATISSLPGVSSSWITSNAAGDTVTVWKGTGDEGTGVYYSILNGATGQLSQPRLIDLGQTESAYAPKVVIDQSGNFAITWLTYSNAEQTISYWIRRYDASGSPFDALPVLVAEDSDAQYKGYSLTVNESGRILFVWEDEATDSSSNTYDGLFFRRFTTTGLSLDAAPREFFPSTTSDILLTTSGRTAVVKSDGGFYLTWREANEIHLAEFSPDGFQTGESTIVDAPTFEAPNTGYVTPLDIAIGPDDTAYVAWLRNTSVPFTGGINNSSGADSTRELLVAQVATGGEIGNITDVQTITSHDEWVTINNDQWYEFEDYLHVDRPTLSVDGLGRFGIAWERTEGWSFSGNGYSPMAQGPIVYGVQQDSDIENEYDQDYTDRDVAIAWFDVNGASLQSAPILIEKESGTDIGHPTLTSDASGIFVLTTQKNDEELWAQQFVLPNSLSLVNGVLTIEDTGLRLEGDIRISTKLVDGERHVALNGVATEYLAADVTKIVVHGSASYDRIDLSQVSDRYFTGLVGAIDASSQTAPIEIYAGSGDDTIIASPFGGSYYGEDGKDQLNGGAGIDLLYGGEDADTLSGGDNDDQLWGEAGDDNLLGGEGDDVLHGGDDNDQLYGQTGNDETHGDDGEDLLDAGEGEHQITDGGLGDDVFYIMPAGLLGLSLSDPGGTDTIDASAAELHVSIDLENRLLGFDLGPVDSIPSLLGSGDIENVIGTDLDDVLIGSSGDNHLEGGGGADEITGSGGNDTLSGGVGDDVYFVAEVASSTEILDVAGTDTLDLSTWNDSEGVSLDLSDTEESQFLNHANTVALVNAGLSSLEVVIGTPKDDVLVGDGSGVELRGGDGVDSLDSYGRDDLLLGEGGFDEIESIDTPTTLSSNWTDSFLAGFNSQQHEFVRITGSSDNAQWSFSGLAQGEYEVYVTWNVDSVSSNTAATDAAFRVDNGSATVDTIVDQSQLPQGESLGGVAWQQLANTTDDSLGRYSVDASGLLTIELMADGTGGAVFADAVRIVRYNKAPTLSVTGSLAADGNGDVNLSMSADDPDGANADVVLTLAEISSSGATLSNLGNGNWTLDWNANGRTGTFPVTILITDENGEGVTTSKTLLLTNGSENNAPSVPALQALDTSSLSPNSIEIDEDELLTFDVISSSDSGESLTYSLSDDAPDGAHFDATNANRFVWTPTEDQDGEHTFDIYVTDSGNPPLRVSLPVTIKVNDGNDLPELVAGSLKPKYSMGTPTDIDYGDLADGTFTGEVYDSQSLGLVDIVFRYGTPFPTEDISVIGEDAYHAYDESVSIFVSEEDPAIGKFTFSPSSSLISQATGADGKVTVYARPREWQPTIDNPLWGAYVYGAAESFVFTPAVNNNIVPVVTLELADDTGSSATDGITSNPIFQGNITNVDGPVDDLLVKIYDTDPQTGTPDPIASVRTAEDGSFTWSPTATEATSWNPTTLHAVAEEIPQLATESEIVSESLPASLGVTYSPIAPPEITLVENADGTFSGQLTAGNVASPIDGWMVHYAITADGAALPTASDAIAKPDDSGNFSITIPANQTGDLDLWVWATRWDDFSSSLVKGATDAGSSVSAVKKDFSRAIPSHGGLPVLTFETFSGAVQDPTVRGVVTNTNGPVAGAIVEFWVDPAGSVSTPPSSPSSPDQYVGVATTNSEGEFEFATGLNWGESVTLFARARDYAVIDPSSSSSVSSLNDGTSVAVEIERAAEPEVWLLDSLELVYNEAAAGVTPLTSLPIIEGKVYYEGLMSDLLVEIDYEGRTREVLVAPEPDPTADNVGTFRVVLEELVFDELENTSYKVDARVIVPSYQPSSPIANDLLDDDGNGGFSSGWFLDGYDEVTGTWDTTVVDQWFDDASNESSDWRSVAGELEEASPSEGYVTAWNEAKDSQGDPVDASMIFDLTTSGEANVLWGAEVTLDSRSDNTIPTISGALSYDGKVVSETTLLLYFDDNGNWIEEGRVTTDETGNFLFVSSSHLIGASNTFEIRALTPEFDNQLPTEVVVGSTISLAVDADLELTTEEVSLKSPTAPGEAVDPTLIGHVTGYTDTTLLQVEVDVDNDGKADTVVYVDTNGEFEVTPELLLKSGFISQAVSVRIRVGETRNSTTGEKSYIVHGEWSDPIDWTAIEKTAPAITSFRLANDTGAKHSSGATILDRITSDPTVTGQVAEGRSYVTVELSYDGGVTVSDSALTNFEGRFTYTPDLSLGHYDLLARVVEYDPVTGSTLQSAWVSIEGSDPVNSFNGFVLVAPDAFAAVIEGKYTSSSYDPTVYGHVDADPNGDSYRAADVIVDFYDASDRYLGSTVTDESGEFIFTPIGLDFGNNQSVIARARQDDRYSEAVPDDLLFDIPVYNKRPGFSTTSITYEWQADLQTVSLSGNVSFSTGEALYVEIDLGDRIETTPVRTTLDGEVTKYSFDYETDRSELTDDSIYFRLVGVDSNGYAYSDWATTVNSIPTAFAFAVTQSDPAASASVTLLPVVSGEASVLPSTFTGGSQSKQSDSEYYIVEFDYNGDGFGDDSLLVDELDGGSTFSFSHEMIGFEPGTIELSIRVLGAASYGESDDQIEVYTESEWETWEVEYTNPAPSVDSIEFQVPEEADANQSKTPVITGVVSSPLSVDFDGLYIEVDENFDGVTDGTATVNDARGVLTFTYTLQDTTPRNFADTPLQIRATDTLSDTTPLEGDWIPFTYLELIDHAEANITIDGLELDEAELGELPISSSPVLIGTIDVIAEATNRQVDFDHNGDGIVDGYAEVDAFGNFRYKPQELAYGQHQFSARSVDQIEDRTRTSDWQDTGFVFINDSVEAPIITELNVVDEERGIIEGRVTVGGYGESVTVSFEATPAGGSAVEKGSITTSDSGYFRYELPELATLSGSDVYTISVTAGVDDPYSPDDVQGELRTVQLDYAPTVFVSPEFVGTQLAFDSGIQNGNSITRVAHPIVTGQIDEIRPQTYVELVSLDNAAPTETQRVPVRDDGSFEYTPYDLLTGEPLTDGEHTIVLRLVSWDAENETMVPSSTDQTVTFDLDQTLSAAPSVSSLDLRNYVDNPAGIQQSADPRFVGQLTGNGPLGGLTIYFDHNQDGIIDGQATTKSDGSFYYYAPGIEPGDLTQRLDASVVQTNYWGESFASSASLEFELTRSPLIASVDYAPNFSLTLDAIEGEVYYEGEPGADVHVEYLFFCTGTDFATSPDNLYDYLQNHTGVSIQSVPLMADGTFTIPAIGDTAGDFTVYVRGVDHASAEGTLTGPWQSLDYTVLPTVGPPPISGFAPEFYDSSDIDADGFAVISDPSLQGSMGISNAFGVVELKVEQIDALNPNLVLGESTYRTNADINGDFSFSPPGLNWGSRYKITARSMIFDPDTGLKEFLATGVETNIVLLQAGVATITSLDRVVDGSVANTGTTVGGQVARSGGAGARIQGLRVDLSISYGTDMPDDEPDAYAFTDANGNFDYTIFNAVVGQNVNVKARVVDWDPIDGQFTNGDYTSVLTFTPTVTDLPDEQISEELQDEVDLAALAVNEAENLILGGLANKGATNTDGRSVVVTPLGDIQLLHLGAAGVGGIEEEGIGVVFDLNEGSFTAGNAWFDQTYNPETVVRNGDNFFVDASYSVDLNALNTATSVIDPIVTTEIIGDELVETSITIANIEYDFELKASLAADSTLLASNHFEIEQGAHRIEESLSFDFWVTRTTTTIGDPDSAETITTAGDYSVVYEDGIANFSDLVDPLSWNVIGIDTLSGGTVEQEFEFTEDLTVDSWVGEELGAANVGSSGQQDSLVLTVDGGGIIDENGIDTTQEETSSGNYQVVDTYTDVVTTASIVPGGGQITSSDTITTTENYEVISNITTHILPNGDIQTDFDITEIYTSSFTQVGWGSDITGDPTSGSGSYSNTSWNYEVTGTGDAYTNVVGTHIESYDGADTLDASINFNGSQNLDGNGSYTSSYRTESGNSDGIQAVVSSLSSDPSSTSTGSDNYQAGTSSGSVQFGANNSGDGEASVSAIGESVNANGSSNWSGGGGAISTGTGSGSFARTTIANDDVITKIVGNYETKGNGESSGGGGGDGTFSLEDQARKANANFDIAGVTAGSLSSQTTGTITTHIPDVGSYTVPFRNNQFASGGSDASLDALASIEPLASITSRANGDVDAGENGFSFNTSFVGLKSDTIDSGFDLTISSTKTDNGEEYDFDSKEGDLTRNGTFHDESLQRVFNLTFATGTDEKSSGSTHSTIKWSSLDNSFVEADRSLEGAFAEFGLNASSEGGSTPIIRTASGDIDDTVTTWSKSITKNTTETRRGFVEDEDGEWTIEKDPSTEDYDAAYAKYNSLVITNGDSEVHTTGTARLVNDVIVQANMTAEFNTHGDSRIIQNGSGYDTSLQNQNPGASDQSKLKSRTDWSNNSTITANSNVVDGKTTTRYLLGVSGSKTDLTVTQNGKSNGGGTATTVADAYSGWAEADGDNSAGYKTHTHSEVTVTSSGGGDSESTSEGWYASGSLGGSSSRLASSFEVDSEVNGNGKVVTTWNVSTTGDQWSENSGGSQTDGSNSNRNFDGTVVTGFGVTGSSGMLTTKETNQVKLNSEAHSKDNRNDNNQYTDASAIVDQSTTINASGKLYSGGLAGQSGYSAFVPNGDPEIIETGSYDFEVTSGWEIDENDLFAWGDTSEWSSGGIDQPQKTGSSNHYVKETTNGNIEESTDNFRSSETVTSKQGERGLKEVTTAKVDNFHETITNPTGSSNLTKTDTKTEVGTTTTTFTSAGSQKGDKQELVIDHDLTKTTTNHEDYDKSGNPKQYDLHYAGFEIDLELFTYSYKTTEVDKNYYNSSHNLGGTGSYQATDESSKEVRKTGDGDYTVKWVGSFDNGSGNEHGSDRYVSSLDYATSSSTRVDENGTYDSLNPATSQSGSYTSVTTEAVSASSDSNYSKKIEIEYWYLDDGPFEPLHNYLTKVRDYTTTYGISADKETRTQKSGSFGENAPAPSSDEDGTTGHDNYYHKHRYDGLGQLTGPANHQAQRGTSNYPTRQQLTLNRDGSQSGFQTQTHSVKQHVFDLAPVEGDDFEPYDYSNSGAYYRDDLGQNAPSDTPADVPKEILRPILKPTTYTPRRGQGSVSANLGLAQQAAFNRLDNALAILEYELTVAGQQGLATGTADAASSIAALDEYHDAFVEAAKRGDVTGYNVSPYGLSTSDGLAKYGDQLRSEWSQLDGKVDGLGRDIESLEKVQTGVTVAGIALGGYGIGSTFVKKGVIEGGKQVAAIGVSFAGAYLATGAIEYAEDQLGLPDSTSTALQVGIDIVAIALLKRKLVAPKGGKAPIVGPIRPYDEATKARVPGYDNHHLDPKLGRVDPDYPKGPTIGVRNDNAGGRVPGGVNLHTAKGGFQTALNDHINKDLGFTIKQWNDLPDEVRKLHLRRYYASLGIPFPF